jgi:predicted P-loop ATPase/GTPase
LAFDSGKRALAQYLLSGKALVAATPSPNAWFNFDFLFEHVKVTPSGSLREP